MGKKQNDLGRQTEEQVAEFFNSFDYWAYILPKKINGQPFDIIARRENDIWFVDAKHVNSKDASFSFKNVEPNQITSMKYCNVVANIHDNMGFIIVWDRTPEKYYYFPYGWFENMKSKGEKSVKIEKLLDLERIINKNDGNKNKQSN